MIVLNPTARRVAQDRPPSARVEGLRGKVVGLLDNSKPRADDFLLRVGERLVREYGVAGTIYMRKLSPSSAAIFLDELVSGADLVINAFGD